MEQQQGVYHDRHGSMQGVEADAAALGIVDRVGQQVIDIDQQPRQHQAVVLQPGLAVDRPGERKRQDDV